MLNVLIVDDEINICNLVNKLICWDDYSLKLVGFAANGPEAYEIICKEEVDILITDVRMPVYDGIELIGRAKKVKSDLTCIIISGHKDFEYAHKALKYGVEDYLLKPINKVELNNIIKEICTSKDIKIKKDIEDKNIRRELANKNSKLKEKFLVDLYNDSIINVNATTINDNYGITLKKDFVMSFIINIDCEKEDNIKLNKIISTKIKEIILQQLPDCNTVINLTNELIGAIITYSTDEKQKIIELIKDIYEQCKVESSFYCDSEITFAIGHSFTVDGDLNEVLKTALTTLSYKVIRGGNKILRFEDNIIIKEVKNNFIDKEKEEELLKLIAQGDLYKFRLWLNNIFNKIMVTKDITPDELFSSSKKILEILTTFISGGEYHHLINKELIEQSFLHNFEKATSIKEILIFIASIYEKYFKEFKSLKEDESKRPIRIAKTYLLNNYNSQISLDELAEKVYLNPVYLSVLFKKEEGVNISDYLINIRIDESKKLLKQSSLNISEIAIKVGYKDTKYFSKLFKKVVGIKPGEYRKLYG